MGSPSLTPASLTAQTTLQDARQEQMLQQLQSLKGSGNDAKIEKSAQDFEAMLLSSWLQQAEQSFGTVPDGDDDDNSMAGKDQMMSMGVQSLAQSLAASGGIGIARMISRALHRAENHQQDQQSAAVQSTAAAAAQPSEKAGNR